MLYFSFWVLCLTSGLTSSSSFRILGKLLNCNQTGLSCCKLPTIYKILGSKVTIVDKGANQSLCVQFSYSFNDLLNPQYKKWMFSLDVVVEPRHTYTVSLFNLPEPDTGHYRITKQITVPGCDDKKIQETQLCQENGSLWDPNISAVFNDGSSSVIVVFNAAQYSKKYQVSIQSEALSCSKMISKGNRTMLNVPFEGGSCQLSLCKILVKIQPFFVRCRNDCEAAIRTFDLCCRPRVTTPSAAKQQPEVFQVQERKRVFIIYSLDHPLYKNVVLRFCAFLVAKCGTRVVMDMLDSTRLGVLGSIQWLDWHKEQIESSSDKILILCSRGVQAKWKAMCGDKQVFLKEDARSPTGDMLTPSLTLMVPHFIRSLSFDKYIVTYFDGICSEEDVPSPFNITVRYKLMKQFEEVFFRILNIEKHEPGRVRQINGLSEEKYHQCPSGRALHDAIEAFHAYQLEHPQWFEEELLESSDLEDEEVIDEVDESKKTFTNHLIYCVLDSEQVVSHVETEEINLTLNKSELQQAEF
ncbi:interleukin-17 receptor A [Nematolebias whitei]|uniref:interleukin-17 receptor A n=1 Tax=Nematolebias whitei TaxID=451745 RepID=UPI00189992D6|nr:interleukin-17 receptor A [Nematolebias whitei]